MLAINNWYKAFEYQVLEKKLGSHINLGPITFFGFNSMALAITIATSRWGYICFRPTTYFRGMWWRWYFYISPDSTPPCSTFAIGPGVDKYFKMTAPIRRKLFGISYSTTPEFIEWNRNLRDHFEYIYTLNHSEDRG